MAKNTTNEELDLQKAELDKKTAMLDEEVAKLQVEREAFEAEKVKFQAEREEVEKTRLEVTEKATEVAAKKTELDKTDTEEKVAVQLYKDKNTQSDVFVSVNGKTYQIKRGVQVMVPKSVKEVLDNREKMDNLALTRQQEATKKFA